MWRGISSFLPLLRRDRSPSSPCGSFVLAALLAPPSPSRTLRGRDSGIGRLFVVSSSRRSRSSCRPCSARSARRIASRPRGLPRWALSQGSGRSAAAAVFTESDSKVLFITKASGSGSRRWLLHTRRPWLGAMPSVRWQPRQPRPGDKRANPSSMTSGSSTWLPRSTSQTSHESLARLAQSPSDCLGRIASGSSSPSARGLKRDDRRSRRATLPRGAGSYLRKRSVSAGTAVIYEAAAQRFFLACRNRGWPCSTPDLADNSLEGYFEVLFFDSISIDLIVTRAETPGKCVVSLSVLIGSNTVTCEE